MKTTRIVSILIFFVMLASFPAYADYFQKMCIYNKTSSSATYDLYLNNKHIKENSIWPENSDCEWGHNDATRFNVKISIYEEKGNYITVYSTEIDVDAKKGKIDLKEFKGDQGRTQYKACSYRDNGSLENCKILK